MDGTWTLLGRGSVADKILLGRDSITCVLVICPHVDTGASKKTNIGTPCHEHRYTSLRERTIFCTDANKPTCPLPVHALEYALRCEPTKKNHKTKT